MVMQLIYHIACKKNIFLDHENAVVRDDASKKTAFRVEKVSNTLYNLLGNFPKASDIKRDFQMIRLNLKDNLVSDISTDVDNMFRTFR